jgi:hypothetical protein
MHSQVNLPPMNAFDLKVGFTPRMGQNRFHEGAKAGTIAPFFIKALVLGDTFADICATLRCSDATKCPTSAHSPKRPCWPP